MRKNGLLFLSIFVLIFFRVGYSKDFSIREHIILDDLINESVNYLYKSFSEVPQVKFVSEDESSIEGFAMLIENDIEEKVFNNMQKAFTRTSFRIYEKKRVEKILQEQQIQMQDFYSQEGRMKVGHLTQWKGFLIGKINPRIEGNLGKKRMYIETSCSFLNLETGEIIWSEAYSGFKKVHFPIKYFLIFIVGIFILMKVFNHLSKGKITGLILTSGFLAMLLFSVWFFLI